MAPNDKPSPASELAVGSAKISLIQGDIARIAADVIVNAANSDLIGGGGVDGAIHRAGGPSIMSELNRLRPKGGCPPGAAVLTKAGALPAKFVVHAVGPIWRGGGFQEAETLADAYRESLRLAAEKSAARVSFPSLSTGAFGYPINKAAPVALKTVAEVLKVSPGTIREAVFVLFDGAALRAYESALEALRQGV